MKEWTKNQTVTTCDSCTLTRNYYSTFCITTKSNCGFRCCNCIRLLGVWRRRHKQHRSRCMGCRKQRYSAFHTFIHSCWKHYVEGRHGSKIDSSNEILNSTDSWRPSYSYHPFLCRICSRFWIWNGNSAGYRNINVPCIDKRRIPKKFRYRSTLRCRYFGHCNSTEYSADTLWDYDPNIHCRSIYCWNWSCFGSYLFNA